MEESQISASSNGIGVFNVQKRIELFFNKQVIFSIKSEKEKFTRIKLFLKVV